MKHIFISYARADRPWATRIARELRKAQRKDWLDTDEIEIGGDWLQAIEQALRAASSVVVILSPKSAASEYVTYEWAFALGVGIPVIPVLVEATRYHPRLATMQHLDFTIGTPRWGRLIDSLRRPEEYLNSPVPELKPPSICAEFDIIKGNIIRVEDSYRIFLSIKNTPDDTERANYKILDESYTLKERKFGVARGTEEFRDWITSYGDILLAAKGSSRDGTWQTQSTLSEALRRTYGPQPPDSIQQAINDIEKN